MSFSTKNRDEKPAVEDRPQTINWQRARLLLMILVVVGLLGGGYAWKVRQEIDDAHIFRLQSLKSSAAEIEEIFRLSLETVRNLPLCGEGSDCNSRQDQVSSSIVRQRYLQAEWEETKDVEEREGEKNKDEETEKEPIKGNSKLILETETLSLKLSGTRSTMSVGGSKSCVSDKIAEGLLRPVGGQGFTSTLSFIKTENNDNYSLRNIIEIQDVAVRPELSQESGDSINYQSEKVEKQEGQHGFWRSDENYFTKRYLRKSTSQLLDEVQQWKTTKEEPFNCDQPPNDLEVLRLKVESAEQKDGYYQAIAGGDVVFLIEKGRLEGKHPLEGQGLVSMKKKVKWRSHGEYESEEGIEVELTEEEEKKVPGKTFDVKLCDPCLTKKQSDLLVEIEKNGWRRDSMKLCDAVLEVSLKRANLNGDATETTDDFCRAKLSAGEVTTIERFHQLELPTLEDQDWSILVDKMVFLKIKANSDANGSRISAVDLHWQSAGTALDQANECKFEVGDIPLSAEWVENGIEIRWEKKTTRKTPKLSLDLEKMVDEVVEQEIFDYVAVFDHSGRNRWSRDRVDLPFPLRLSKLPVRSPQAGEKPNGSKEPGEEDEKALAFGGPSTMSESVEIAETGIRLLCQPVRVPAGMNENGHIEKYHSWMLCGALTEGRLFREAVGWSPGTATWWLCAMLFLLGLSGFIKLRLMAPQEKLRRIDLIWFKTGALLMVMVLSVGCAVSYHFLSKRRDLDDQLVELGDQLRSSLVEDMQALHEQLDELDSKHADPDEYAGPEKGWVDDEALEDGVVREVCLFALEARPSIGPCKSQRGDESRRLAKYLGPESPLFNQVFWVDEKGDQIHKATSRDKNTNKVTVKERPYFFELMAGNGLDGRALADPKPIPRPTRVVIQTLRSKTIGQEIFALSRRSRAAEQSASAKQNPSPSVVVLTGVLPAMEAWVTPPFDFAVIDSEGKVVMSSRDNLRIGANVLGLVEPAGPLRRGLRVPTPIFGAKIEGQPHRMRMQPLVAREMWQGVPSWRIMTFYRCELPSTLMAESVILALAQVLPYVLIFGLCSWFFPWQTRQLFWWHREMEWAFRVAAGLFALLALGAYLCWDEVVAGWIQGTHWAPALLALAVAWQLIAWSTLSLAQHLGQLRQVPGSGEDTGGPTDPPPGRVVRAARWLGGKLLVQVFRCRLPVAAKWTFQLAIGLFFVVIGVLPALLFSQSAWTASVVNLDRGLELWHEQAMEERRLRIRQQWSGFVGEKRIKRRLESRGDRFFPPVWTTAAKLPEGSFLHRMSDRLPVYNDSTELVRFSHRLGGRSRGEGLSYTTPSYSGRGKKASLVGGPEVSVLPGLLSAGLLAALAILSLQVYRICFKIRAPMDLTTAELGDLQQELESGGSRRLLVVTSRRQVQAVEAIDSMEKLDLVTRETETVATAAASASDPLEGAKDIGLALPGEEGRQPPRLIVGLERALADPALCWPAWSSIRRCILESTCDRSVWLLSRIDPVLVLEEASAKGGEQRDAAAIADSVEADRWLRLLGRFERAYLSLAPGQERGESEHLSMLWHCSNAERLTLQHLAEERVVNPKQEKAVQSLVSRGLLHLDGRKKTISFMDEHFRRFVESQARPLHLVEWEKEAGRQGWRALRVPILAVFLVLFSSLFFFNRDLFKSVEALMATLAASVPLAVNLLSRLGAARGQG